MARRPGNAGVHTGTAPRSGARGRIAQFRDGARLGTYPTRQSGTPARERRPPVGTARERETSADDTALYQLEFRTLFQSRMPRPLTAPPTRGRAFLHARRGVREDPIMRVFPGGGSAGDASRLNHASTRRSSLRFGRNTLGPVLPVGAPPSRAFSAGRLTSLGAHATSSTGC